MTTTLTIRLPAATKAALKLRAKPTVNAWLNSLIDRALSESDVDWNEHFDWLRQHGRIINGHPGDEMRQLNR